MSRKVVIIGSGIGGATMAASLAQSDVMADVAIQILEKGGYLTDHARSRDEKAVYQDGYFRPDETWHDEDGNAFNPGNYYYIGGNSKFYGAVMIRYRAEDFAEMPHLHGISPAWPISYETLEPWYQKAEELYQVCGKAVANDPTEPHHSGSYPKTSVPHEKAIQEAKDRLDKIGVSCFDLPLAMDLDQWLAEGKTPWDGFPNTGQGKLDAETAALSKAVKYPNVEITPNAEVVKLVLAEDSSKIDHVICNIDGQETVITGDLFILSAGAIQSAALLLRSAETRFPNGLANSSDAVGRYFMNHNCSAVMALHPFRKNDSLYQKTLGINDFYLADNDQKVPLGNIQLLGKISGNILKSASPSVPQFMCDWIANRSVDWYVMSEDLPNAESRILLDDNKNIVLKWERSNTEAHNRLVKKFKGLLRQAGYPITLSRPFDKRTPSHQCGTTRMGDNPADSVVDIWCRSHDHANLFIVDAGFLPTSAAVNPALTIAAQALRVSAYIREKEFAA